MIQQEWLKKGISMVTDIVRHDPFANLRQTMDRLFDDSFFRTPTRLFDEGTLPVDISEHDGALLVKASLPGFEKDDIDVQVNEGVLSIKAQHRNLLTSPGTNFRPDHSPQPRVNARLPSGGWCALRSAEEQ